MDTETIVPDLENFPSIDTGKGRARTKQVNSGNNGSLLAYIGCFVLAGGLAFASVRLLQSDGRPGAAEIESIVKSAIITVSKCANFNARYEHFSIAKVETFADTAGGFPVRANFSLICPSSAGPKRFQGDASKVITFVRRDMLNEWEAFNPYGGGMR